jgi:tetratricopeptide (TPR) repeat protein
MENISLCIFRYLIEINASVFVIFFSTAFLRRGMAYKALKNQELAVEDFKSMLKIDPNNKRAKVIPHNSQVVNTGRAFFVLSFIPISNLLFNLNISGFVG